MVKSGFGAVNQLLWSLFFFFFLPKAAENTGVLFAFLYAVKKSKKDGHEEIRTKKSKKKSSDNYLITLNPCDTHRAFTNIDA